MEKKLHARAITEMRDLALFLPSSQYTRWYFSSIGATVATCTKFNIFLKIIYVLFLSLFSLKTILSCYNQFICILYVCTSVIDNILVYNIWKDKHKKSYRSLRICFVNKFYSYCVKLCTVIRTVCAIVSY